MHVDVVHVALRAVEEDAAAAGKGAFHRAARKPRPVGGDVFAANHVGMVAEIDQHQRVAAFAVQAQHVDALVHFANGLDDVRVAHAGIGLYAAVAHAEAAHKGHVRGVAHGVSHPRRAQIFKGEAGRVHQAMGEQLRVFAHQRVLAAFVPERAGVRVRAGDQHRGDRQPQRFGDALTAGVECGGRGQAAVVDAEQHGALLPARKRQRADFQSVQHAPRIAGHIIAGNADAHHRSHVGAGKTRLKLSHG